jgi:tetratricopeptide (TPR) repeat protein
MQCLLVLVRRKRLHSSRIEADNVADTPDNITYGTPDADGLDSLLTGFLEREVVNGEGDEGDLIPDAYPSGTRSVKSSVTTEEGFIPPTTCSTTASSIQFRDLEGTNIPFEMAQTMLAATHLQEEPSQIEETVVYSISEDELQWNVDALTPSRHSESSLRADEESQPEKSPITTVAEAKGVLTLAVEMEKAGSSLREIFQHLELMPQYLGADDISGICDHLERLISRYKKKKRLVEAKMAVELVVIGRTKQFGKSSKKTLRAVCRRASIFERCKLYDLAETSYRSVIEECLHSGDIKNLSRCQHSLGDLLRHLGRHSEALILLLQALFGFCSSQYLISDASPVLDSILKSHAKMYSASSWAHVSDCIARMKEVFNSSSQSSQSLATWRQSWLELVHLASAYSVMGKFDNAERCFSFAIPKIESSLSFPNQNAKAVQMNKIHAC